MEQQGFDLEATSYAPPPVFCAYPGRPSVSETFRRAKEAINKRRTAEWRLWEDLSIGGKFIIDEILKGIDAASLVCADLTYLNQNVLFELGYAIAANKRIWLLLDDSVATARNNFSELRLLTTIGYQRSTNSELVVSAFFKDNPLADTKSTIFDGHIKPSLNTLEPKLLYLKSKWDTNASIDISNRISRSSLRKVVDDPAESALQPIVWYAQNTYSAIGVCCHFTNPNREGSVIHNSRQALVCGMAHGFGRPLLMLADEDYVSPLDYRDLLKTYKSSDQAARFLEEWLGELEAQHAEIERQRTVHADVVKLATELADFQLHMGDYVAENEVGQINEYFVATAAYQEARDGRQAIFAGRKGTGKTANFLKLSTELSSEPGTIVCSITPVAYEIESIVRLFENLEKSDAKGYVVEALWKFLIYTEIANATVAKIEQRNVWEVASEAEKELQRLMSTEGSVLAGDFAVRLERAVKPLLELQHRNGIEETRLAISETLHSTVLSKLRRILGEVLSEKRRVAVLVDNLDKPWTRHADIQHLSNFLLGLFSVGPQMSADFKKASGAQRGVNLSIAIFIRSDIFSKILERAPEPDKIRYTRLQWDKEMLLRVIEERYEATHKGAPGREIWHKYFPRKVKGVELDKYLLDRILPRPRDIVYFIKAAVSNAVNRRHGRVEELDLVNAEPEYSHYAIKSILVENGVTMPELNNIIIEFVGANKILTEQEVRQIILASGIEKSKVDYALDHLVGLTFLGLEIREGDFQYAEDLSEFQRQTAIAKKMIRHGKHRMQRYEINPAFYSYLEIR
jgi:hypothetical protein